MSKEAKEAFVSGHAGTTFLEIVLVTSVLPFARLLHGQYLNGPWHKSEPSQSHILLSEVLLVILPVLVLNVGSCVFSVLCALLGGLLGLHFVAFQYLCKSDACPSKRGGKQGSTDIRLSQHLNENPSFDPLQEVHGQPYRHVEMFRGGLTLYTCLAILAVDFPSFPRRWAKAETYGQGLMDLGPGLFVFSSGLTMAMRATRPRLRGGPRCRKTLLRRAGQSIGPLVLLGLTRLVAMRALNYQEHVSEYGRHWNFFFTLGAVNFAGASVPLIGRKAAIAAAGILAVHQLVLGRAGIAHWLEAPHVEGEGLLSANKEGVLSLPGYVALFYIGAASASLLTASSSEQHHSRGAWYTRLGAYVFLSWFATLLLDTGVQQVSRQFSNAAYVSWICGSALVQLLLASLAVQLVHYAAIGYGGSRRAQGSPILESLSRHQLACFLVANVMTGVVNMSVDTLAAPTQVTFAILVIHMSTWCTVGAWVPWMQRQVPLSKSARKT